jgi:hypothetical protein
MKRTGSIFNLNPPEERRIDAETIIIPQPVVEQEDTRTAQPVSSFPVDDATETPAPPPTTETKPASRRSITAPKVLILILMTLVVAAGGFLVYRYYQVSKVRSAIEPLVQNVTLRTSNDIKYDIEPSKVTYKELFEKIDKDLSEIESKKIDIQTIASRFDQDEILASLNYMNSCQGLLRALESKYYKQLALSNSFEWHTKAYELYLRSGYYGRYYAKQTLDEADKDIKKKEEEFNGSVDDLSKALKDIEPTRGALARFISDKSILENDLLLNLAKKNEKDRTKSIGK